MFMHPNQNCVAKTLNIIVKILTFIAHGIIINSYHFGRIGHIMRFVAFQLLCLNVSMRKIMYLIQKLMIVCIIVNGQDILSIQQIVHNILFVNILEMV